MMTIIFQKQVTKCITAISQLIDSIFYERMKEVKASAYHGRALSVS